MAVDVGDDGDAVVAGVADRLGVRPERAWYGVGAGRGPVRGDPGGADGGRGVDVGVVVVGAEHA